MATRPPARKPAVSAEAATPAKKTPRRAAPTGSRAAPKGTAEAGTSAKPAADGHKPSLPGADLLKAGLKALGGMRDDAALRHSQVFESLLGKKAPASGKTKAGAFKLPTFDDLFDERVARSLERIGATEALVALKRQLDALDRRLAQLERLQQPKPGPRRKSQATP